MKLFILFAVLAVPWFAARADARDGYYFSLKEGSIRDVLKMNDLCLKAHAEWPALVRSMTEPNSYCFCLTDLTRHNFRTTGKAIPTEPEASVCRTYANTSKKIPERKGTYFELVEGATRDIDSYYRACLAEYAKTSAEKRRAVNGTIFCECVTDAVRVNARITGKMFLAADDVKVPLCSSYASTKK